MPWEDFVVSGQQVAEYAPSLNLTADKLLDFISLAQSDVEDRLKILIHHKYQNAGKTLPDDLPDPELDAVLSYSFDMIRKAVVYKTLQKIYALDDTNVSIHWESQYDKVDWGNIFIDIDQDQILDSDEFELDYQYMLDSRFR